MTTPFKGSIALNERLRCVYKKSHTVIGFFIDNDYKSAAKLHWYYEIFLRRCLIFICLPSKKGKNMDVQLLDVKNTVERDDHVIFHDQYLVELIHLFQLSRNSEI